MRINEAKTFTVLNILQDHIADQSRLPCSGLTQDEVMKQPTRSVDAKHSTSPSPNGLTRSCYPFNEGIVHRTIVVPRKA